MKRLAIYSSFLFALLLLWGCALFNQQKQPLPPARELPAQWLGQEKLAEVIPPEPPKPEQKVQIHNGKGKRGGPGQPNSRARYPLVGKQGYEERGIASWYGPSFHGRTTSSGEIFDMYKISAAHKLLPMHAKLSVTNLENGRSLVLTVNDRGPYVAGRILDLSYAAARNLDMVNQGLARVLIRTSEPVPGQRNNDIVGEFFIYIGSFESEADAKCLLEDMKSLQYKSSMIKTVRAERDGEIHWRVEVGPYKSMSKANRAHSMVVKDYPSAFVVAAEQ